MEFGWYVTSSFLYSNSWRRLVYALLTTDAHTPRRPVKSRCVLWIRHDRHGKLRPRCAIIAMWLYTLQIQGQSKLRHQLCHRQNPDLVYLGPHTLEGEQATRSFGVFVRSRPPATAVKRCHICRLVIKSRAIPDQLWEHGGASCSKPPRVVKNGIRQANEAASSAKLARLTRTTTLYGWRWAPAMKSKSWEGA